MNLLLKLKKKCKKIVRENVPIEREVVSREEAIKRFKAIGDQYKLELIEAIPEDETVTIYTQGEFSTFVAESMFLLLVKFKCSNYLAWLVHTGVAIVTTKCYNAFTAQLSSIKMA